MQKRMMITGAGSGLGREIALRWAREGWQLALSDVNDAGLAETLKLVREADVLVHNFRPSVPRRLGIDHEQLNLINPRLIYCAVSGYGETGPMKDKAGYDQVLQTMTGMCALQGKRGGAHMPVMVCSTWS